MTTSYKSLITRRLLKTLLLSVFFENLNDLNVAKSLYSFSALPLLNKVHNLFLNIDSFSLCKHFGILVMTCAGVAKNS